MPTRRMKGAVVGLAIGALLVALPAAAGGEEWKWSVTPYFWMTDLRADVSINDQDFVDSKTDVSDLVDKLDFAFQVNLQGQRGRHGLLLDLTYWDFNDDAKRRALPGAGGRELVTRGDFEQTLLDVAAIYNPRGDGEGFALIYGARIIDVDQEIDARIESPAGASPSRRYETSGTLYDGLVGVRYLGRIADRWRFHFKGDLSTGGSELTWSGLAGVGYVFGTGGRHALLAGYRYMKMELDESDAAAEVETRLALSGPYLALKFGL